MQCARMKEGLVALLHVEEGAATHREDIMEKRMPRGKKRNWEARRQRKLSRSREYRDGEIRKGKKKPTRSGDGEIPKYSLGVKDIVTGWTRTKTEDGCVGSMVGARTGGNRLPDRSNQGRRGSRTLLWLDKNLEFSKE